MSAQSIYHTWRGMREADETTSSWLYIAFIDADNSFAMVQEASFADEDLSFDITTRAYGLFSFDGEKLNVMVNENETTSTLDDITFSDEMERQFKKNKALKANMNNQVRATFKQTKDDFEKDYTFYMNQKHSDDLGKAVNAGVVKLVKDLDRDVNGRDVLVVEDIVDSGMTLHYIKSELLHRGATSVRIATLLDKPARRRVELNVEYSCFNIPDAFVVGYGLDYDEKYRNLPDVGILHPRIYTK